MSFASRRRQFIGQSPRIADDAQGEQIEVLWKRNPDRKNASNSNNFTLSLALKGQLGHYLAKSKLASDREG